MNIITGKDLRRVRILSGLTQKEMSRKFKVTRGVYACWESRYKNKRLPSNIKTDVLMLEYSYIEKPEPSVSLMDKIRDEVKRLWNKIRRIKNDRDFGNSDNLHRNF